MEARWKVVLLLPCIERLCRPIPPAVDPVKVTDVVILGLRLGKSI
jgi:hypothetical protein